jgi:exodeoxyribonuclease VII large subunit
MSPQSGTTGTDNDINFNDIYSVSELNREVRSLIETRFPSIWVQGEISNIARPASGHIYFSLKDESAQVRCAMFRMNNRLLTFRPQDGMQVLVRASVSLYETRGDYQLIVSYMEEMGDGVLRRKFDQLKAALAQEGLFDAEYKQDIPPFPSRVGVITSPSGAAIRDVLSVFKRRAPEIPILIYPIPVQGDDAPPRIVHMIRKACRRRDCDVLILTRGGGSLEDLWAFNDERVARAIFECDIPIVCGVGHEIDFTIADFVADVRAPTPSAAAELISPDRNTWITHIERTQARLIQLVTRRITTDRQQLDWLTKRIQHPRQRLQHMAQRLDEIEQRLIHVQTIHRQSATARLTALATRLEQRNPRHRLEKLAMTQQALAARMVNTMQKKLQTAQHRVGSVSRALEAVSPLATLNRGYAIVKKRDDGAIVRDATQLKKGEQLITRFQHGHALSTVDETGDS